MNTATPFFSPVQLDYLNNDQIRQLDAICFEVTSKLFRVDCAERIIDALKYSRAARKGHYRTTPDFRHFIGIYHWIKSQTTDYGDYVVFRKYLKTLSGVYRWHFASFQHHSVRKSLHETIKIEVHCEHCGSVSKVLIDRLIEENLWAVWQFVKMHRGDSVPPCRPCMINKSTTPPQIDATTLLLW